MNNKNVKQSKTFTIWIELDGSYVYFEHNEVGDDYAGGMWFKNKELIDYDGVFELHSELIELMEKEGFNMEYAKDE
jgi:hypothetical protein